MRLEVVHGLVVVEIRGVGGDVLVDLAEVLAFSGPAPDGATQSRYRMLATGHIASDVFCLNVVINALLCIKAHTTAALILLTSVDALLKVGGFNTLHGIVKRWKLRQVSADAPGTIVDGCATVEKACVWHPKQKLCLQKSAVATCLLRSLGVPAEMVIGVHKMPFYGHSWVEVEGTVVNDHKNVQTFFHVLSRC